MNLPRAARFFWIFFLLMLPWGAATMSAAAFSDVPEDHTHFHAIEFLSQRKVISGYPDGTFQPEKKVNRAEALKIILTAAGKAELKPEIELKFKDIDTQAWYIPYLKNAVANSIAQGFEDGTFRPQAEVNKAEFLKILFLAINEKLPQPTENVYVDVERKVWFAPFVARAKTLKLLALEDDGYFHGDYTLSRGQIAEIVYRLMFVRENSLANFDPSRHWPYFEQASLFLKMKFAEDFVLSKTSTDEVIFWKKDAAHGQIDYRRIYPEAATLSISKIMNFTTEKYVFFDQLGVYAKDLQKSKLREISIAGNKAYLLSGENGQNGVLDVHVFLPDNVLLSFYGTYGLGLLKEELKEKIYLMATSFSYVAGGAAPDIDAILKAAREKIWVEGAGRTVLDSFPEELDLIETDSIGTGNGPVDYFYSGMADVSLKYERARDVILAINEGKTSAF